MVCAGNSSVEVKISEVMNLQFDKSLAESYKSVSQKIRVMSEAWLVENLFCPCCGNICVEKLKNNSPVADIFCRNCGEIFELKSKKNSIGVKIIDGAHHKMSWVGCNILYQKIPEQGKIEIIRDGKEIEFDDVLKFYRNAKKLHTNNLSLRGWLLDVLNCINKINSEIFTLQDVYDYAEFLQSKHVGNKNICAKIRQQLQFLRDKGFIDFLGNGTYRKVM